MTVKEQIRDVVKSSDGQFCHIASVAASEKLGINAVKQHFPIDSGDVLFTGENDCGFVVVLKRNTDGQVATPSLISNLWSSHGYRAKTGCSIKEKNQAYLDMMVRANEPMIQSDAPLRRPIFTGSSDSSKSTVLEKTSVKSFFEDTKKTPQLSKAKAESVTTKIENTNSKQKSSSDKKNIKDELPSDKVESQDKKNDKDKTQKPAGIAFAFAQQTLKPKKEKVEIKSEKNDEGKPSLKNKTVKTKKSENTSDPESSEEQAISKKIKPTIEAEVEDVEMDEDEPSPPVNLKKSSSKKAAANLKNNGSSKEHQETVKKRKRKQDTSAESDNHSSNIDDEEADEQNVPTRNKKKKKRVALLESDSDEDQCEEDLVEERTKGKTKVEEKAKKPISKQEDVSKEKKRKQANGATPKVEERKMSNDSRKSGVLKEDNGKKTGSNTQATTKVKEESTKRRRRVLKEVTKTFKTEDGFLETTTTKEMVSETDDSDNDGKSNDGVKKPNPKNSVAVAPKGQASLFAFFKKQ